MGQTPSVPLNSQSQRIRPTPGSSGRRARRGTLSIYCEQSHSIYTVNTNPGMTIADVKKYLPVKNCELKALNNTLSNHETLEKLGIDNKTLVKIVYEDKITHKSTSTADSFPENEMPKIIGPKKFQENKPQKPNNESASSLVEEFPLKLDLKEYAVPDLVIDKGFVKSNNKKCLF